MSILDKTPAGYSALDDVKKIRETKQDFDMSAANTALLEVAERLKSSAEKKKKITYRDPNYRFNL